MNIKDTIKELGLDSNNLPRVLTQRVNAVENLKTRMANAQKEYDDEPTEENEEKLDEIKDYVEEYYDDVFSQLKQYKLSLESNNNGDDTNNVNKEKKSGGAGLLISGILLIATFGAINILKKR